MITVAIKVNRHIIISIITVLCTHKQTHIKKGKTSNIECIVKGEGEGTEYFGVDKNSKTIMSPNQL